MKRPAPRRLALGIGFCMLAAAMLAWAPVAEAQFFWSPWFQEQPRKPKARQPSKPKPPPDDLPPILPKESSVPPPPDDRPYDTKLLRLAEILGAVHYLRELCGAQEGQVWRDQMKDILKFEGSTAVRRAKLVNSFNDGYRGYRRTYRSCTSSATLAITRFSTEGAQIAAALAKPSHYASRNAPNAAASPSANEETPAGTDSGAANQGEANPGGAATGTPAAETPATETPAAGAPPTGAAGTGGSAAGEAGAGEAPENGARKPKRRSQARATESAKPRDTEHFTPQINR